MALTPEERRVLNTNIITGSEYLEVINGTIYDKEEREQIDAQEEEGFVKGQRRALALMRKAIPQVHLIPRNRGDYLDLKTDFGVEYGTNIYHTEPYNYRQLFKEALAGQIGFMHENEAGYDNGYINAAGGGFAIGSYSHSGQSAYDYRKIFNGLYPTTFDCLETMGGTNACLSNPMRIEDFYKGESNSHGRN